MKDSQFIELLNLYVDHQISPTDAALLEAEIQRTPERRKIYRQYCQMQKACMTLSENFRSDAPSATKVGEMAAPAQRLSVVTYAMGFAAAAACVALVVVNRAPDHTELHQQTAPVALSASASGVVEAPVETLTATPRVTLQPAFAGLVKESGTFVAARKTTASDALDWMNNVEVRRLSAADLRFETAPALETQDLTLRSTRSYQGQVETTAFIFAK